MSNRLSILDFVYDSIVGLESYDLVELLVFLSSAYLNIGEKEKAIRSVKSAIAMASIVNFDISWIERCIDPGLKAAFDDTSFFKKDGVALESTPIKVTSIVEDPSIDHLVDEISRYFYRNFRFEDSIDFALKGSSLYCQLYSLLLNIILVANVSPSEAYIMTVSSLVSKIKTINQI